MRIQVIAALLAVLLISGCGPTIKQSRVDRQQALAETGIVVLQLVSNSDRIAPSIATWTSVILDRDDDPDTIYELTPESDGLLHSQMYVGAVPPGNYRIRNLHAFEPNSGIYMNAAAASCRTAL